MALVDSVDSIDEVDGMDRINKLECDAVSILEAIGKMKAHMENSCMPYEARLGASLAKAAMEYRYTEVMGEIEDLTHRGFGNNGHGAPCPYDGMEG